MAKILVTGATGYVGAHTVKVLYDAGHEIHALDRCPMKREEFDPIDILWRMSTQTNDISKYVHKFYKFSLLNIDAVLDQLEDEYDIIVHLAANISPAESMTDAIKYYTNNIQSTTLLLETNIVKFKHFVFASTGSAFDPVSPYSKSKVMCEQIIKDHCKQNNLDFTIFRFFNVAGNAGEFGQTVNPIHIMKLAAMAANSHIGKFTIFGNDYDTRDGTCIRDYIHPEDIATSILSCLDDPANTDYECLAVQRYKNSTIGYSNLEIIEIMKRVTGVDFPVEFGPRREGDAPVFVVDKVSRYLKAKHTIEDMCRQEYELEAMNIV